jgi:hypothetical protein
VDVLNWRHQISGGTWFHIVSLALVISALPLPAQSGSEYEVKAAFLYKFASFVEWPSSSREPLAICILGHDPFGDSLERVVRGKSVGGREFVIRRLKTWQSGDRCDILFISSSEQSHLNPTLDGLPQQAILTVGDLPGFCESGGAINLNLVDSKVKLEINPEAASKNGLQISSKLLNLARIVHHSAVGRTKN